MKITQFLFQQHINNLIKNGNVRLLNQKIIQNQKNNRYKILITPTLIGYIVKNKDITMLHYIINNLLEECINLKLYMREIIKNIKYLNYKEKNLLLTNTKIKIDNKLFIQLEVCIY
jgi:hypothetical protein